MLKVAAEIAGNNQTALAGMKALSDIGASLPLNEALDYEYTTSHAHNDALNLSGSRIFGGTNEIMREIIGRSMGL